MKDYSIEKGILYNDLDCPFDKEKNTIDVYTSVYWTATDESEYKAKEEIINTFKYEDDLISAFAWCDKSGFEYWIDQQQEGNYVSIDVCLKRKVETYTQEEIQKISDLIAKWDDYFNVKLSS